MKPVSRFMPSFSTFRSTSRSLVVATVMLCLLASDVKASASGPAGDTHSTWGDAFHLLLGEAEAGTSEMLQRLHFKSQDPESSKGHSVSKVVQQPETTDASDTPSNNPHHRKLHGEWLKGALVDEHRTRRLAQAPTSVRAFGALNGCRSVTCGGVCCDALYTYGSAMNTNQPCTQPLPTCSASGQCQSQPRLATDVCVGLQFGFQSYPGNSLAINTAGQLGFTCPAAAASACSYLNTYSSDMTLCTQGACIPTITGGLNCIPVIRGLTRFGCVAAVQTFTTAQATVSASAALSG